MASTQFDLGAVARAVAAKAHDVARDVLHDRHGDHVLYGGVDRRQGYEIFAALMEFAYNDGKPTSLAAFEATGRAYLAFARKYPGHYMAMFESGLSLNAHGDLALVAARARNVLERAAEQLSQHLPAGKRPPSTMFSAHIWALSHGVVELYMRGAPGAKSQFPPEDLLEAGIGIYLRGLGLLKPDL